MSNVKKNNGSEIDAQTFDKSVEDVKKVFKAPPTRDQVRQWLAGDIQSAIYSLSSVLGFPALLDKMADEMYEHAQKTPQQIMDEESNKNG